MYFISSSIAWSCQGIHVCGPFEGSDPITDSLNTILRMLSQKSFKGLYFHDLRWHLISVRQSLSLSTVGLETLATEQLIQFYYWCMARCHYLPCGLHSTALLQCTVRYLEWHQWLLKLATNIILNVFKYAEHTLKL